MVNLKSLDNTTIGILSKTMNLAVYSVISVLLKISVSDLHTFQILFLLNISGLIITSSIFMLKKTSVFKFEYIDRFYLSRSLLYTFGIITWVYSLALLPITEATAISYATPLIAALMGIFLFKESVSNRILLASSLGIVGMVIILKPSGSAFGTNGVIFALLSALLWATHDVLVKVQSKKEYWLKQAHVVFLLVSLFSLPLAIYSWKPIANQYLLLFLVIGALSMANKFFLIKALSKVPLVLLSPISFLRLVFTSMLAYFIFGEILDMYSIMGVITIIYSTSLVLKLSRKTEK